MARSAGFRRLLCGTIAVAWALSGRPLLADPLRLVNDDYLTLYENDKMSGLGVEVLRQVFAGLGRDVSFERFPTKRAWMMVVRGERDGMVATSRTSEGERFCSFSHEPIIRDKWVLFVRTADIGKLKFSSFDDLIGHDVAIREAVPEVSEQPTVPPELWSFLRQHHNMVATNGTLASLRMLAAGRVDYAVASLAYGMSEITKMGLSGKIEPLLSRSVKEEGVYVCFAKARVSPAFVDAFSRALKQFKQTEAFQAIYRKYFP
ncbi:substrate-binding periplasmic protein [Mesorhizobium sp.]|uniref:substrate-binding periplasmic protein n=1 Tax=Mesorhizobium sp. TaxID=1871066 RepID=UPI001216E898|nr:transporter substrate-binding domain-containing protein [Mesorhizobium sp.]TIL65692.1 MAG: transporter substrate-binding domain-containing protein [Mesorhizobium sp.]